MKILALTQKFNPDDHILGFLYAWLIKIAEDVDELYIVSLEQRYSVELGRNIKTYSAGKEFGYRKIHIIYKLNKIIADIILKRKIDLVFVLMCPEYVFLVTPYARILNIPIIMWYAHGSVNMRLEIAGFLANRVISSSQNGFRINSNKLTIIGQGIDIEKFKAQSLKFKVNKTKTIILSVGRISPIKNYEVLLRAADILINQRNIRDLEFQIVGDVPLRAQNKYLYFLKGLVSKYGLQDYINFVGPIPYTQIQNYYQNCDLFVSASNTGSLDKAVLEAMACEKIVCTSNEAFTNLLNPYSQNLMFDKNDSYSLAKKIMRILEMDAKVREAIASDLTKVVISNYSLNSFIEKVLVVFEDTLKNRQGL